MLNPGLRCFDVMTIGWEIDEAGITTRFRPEAAQTDHSGAEPLWRACLERTRIPDAAEDLVPVRPRDGLLRAFGIDIDETIHTFLIRLCAAYLDQGLAYWPMPSREDGFYRCVRNLFARRGAIFPELLAGADSLFSDQVRRQFDSSASVIQTLSWLGVEEQEWEQFLTSEALALPGWAGLMRRLEEEPWLAPHEKLPCSLMDYMAVRLTLTAAAVRNLGRAWRIPWGARHSEAERLCKAARLFDVAQLAGFTPEDFAGFRHDEAARLQGEIEQFDDLERRRVFQLAYELWHERSILRPLGAYRRMRGAPPAEDTPSAQVFFCIDEREESTRRHLEEIAPDVETLSAAGFFGIAVDYAGIDDAHGVALCPVVVKPQHAVRELPADEHVDAYKRRKALRLLWARFTHTSYISSRTLVRGWISTATLGLFSVFPLIAHVLSPRRYSAFVKALNDWILPEPRTELTLMRGDHDGHVHAENLLLGFSPEEKAERVASVLGPAGLLDRFARIVVVLGHGSTSLNNPHESAHDCGACGGRRGGPNARLFAAMANRPTVREVLRGRGIRIPGDTWFVGGYHDTCSDQIDYFDLEDLPESHRADFERISERLEKARALEAHERVRRFEAARHGISSADALWHVQERSEHLAEPRPEYGHCTNAVCIVGRRAITRGLFFDRRAFLVSYDPEIDPAGDNLGRLLGAAIPVCAGISLEYYFSFVDNEGYGCGTKLPHNISGLVGVMNGHASDLRTGLPWQMVEIHEPVRVLFVVETSPAVLSDVIGRSPSLSELVVNRWIRLSTIDPVTGVVHVLRDGNWEEQSCDETTLPVVGRSRDWYEGKREHLPVAMIAPRAAVGDRS
jgi:uncharacterized protein YbcC (UPF0753/DUF2309 family)